VITSATITILIADRHEDLLQILKRTTERDNYALMHAGSAEEAAVALERLNSKIELAIVDFPDSSGWNLIGRRMLGERHPRVLKRVKELGVGDAGAKPIPRENLHDAPNTSGWKVRLFVTVGNRCVVQLKAVHSYASP
jgi:hypothetical protein